MYADKEGLRPKEYPVNGYPMAEDPSWHSGGDRGGDRHQRLLWYPHVNGRPTPRRLCMHLCLETAPPWAQQPGATHTALTLPPGEARWHSNLPGLFAPQALGSTHRAPSQRWSQ